MPKVDARPGSWRHLLTAPNLPVILVLAGGVALYAVNVYLASSLLPSAVTEIGDQRLYAWNTTVFLLASVATSVLVARVLRSAGARGAYLIALGAFAAGTLICLLAPSMLALLLGRAVQGAGGGLLAGLAYGLIQSTLPEPLWSRAIAVTSAMWGVGTLVGPALGGALAEFASWRAAFAVLAAACVALAMIVPRALGRDRPQAAAEPLPLLSVTLLVVAALIVSVASVIGEIGLSTLGVVAGATLVAVFVGHERRTRGGRVLPASMFLPGSRLRWLYASLALLAIGSQVEGFVPLFGQQLAGLAPLGAAFLGAASAAGWTLLQIPSSGVDSHAGIRRVSRAGPVVITVGLLGCALTVRPDLGGVGIALWVVALLVVGAGIGLAWPHLSTGVMRDGAEHGDGSKAAAAINSIQLLANAFGAALTGVLVNLATSPSDSARLLFVGIAVITAVGVLTSVRARLSPRSPDAAETEPGTARTPEVSEPHDHHTGCYWNHEHARWHCPAD